MNDLQTVHQTRVKKETSELEGYKLTYTLEVSPGDGAFRSIFSVTIAIEKGTYREEKTAYDITRSRQKAIRIFNLLHRNGVTPCTLMDVLADIL